MEKKTNDEPAIARHAALNPFHYFAPNEVGMLFGFGPRAMTALLKLGAPMVAKKMCPAHFKKWLAANAVKIGKLS